MRPLAVRVRNADRMMTYANPVQDGIELAFADDCKGLIPFPDIPEIRDLSNLASIELPNPHEIVLRSVQGGTVELPWDFARHYCEASYRPRVEAVAARGRQTLGSRIRQLREASSATQEALASAAGIGRVTLIRIENGDQSPRFQTMVSIAEALGCPTQDLLS